MGKTEMRMKEWSHSNVAGDIKREEEEIVKYCQTKPEGIETITYICSNILTIICRKE